MSERFPKIPLAPFLRALRDGRSVPPKHLPKEKDTLAYTVARAHMADEISVVVGDMMLNRSERGPYGLLRKENIRTNTYQVVESIPYLEQFYVSDTVPEDYDQVLPQITRWFQDTFQYELAKYEHAYGGAYIQGFFVEMVTAVTTIQTVIQNWELHYGVRPTFEQLSSGVDASHDVLMLLSMMPQDQAFELVSSLRDGRNVGPWNPDLVPFNPQTGGLEVIPDWANLPNYRTVEKSRNAFWMANLNPAKKIGDIPVTKPNTGCPAHQGRALVNIWEWFMDAAIPSRPAPVPVPSESDPMKTAVRNHLDRSFFGRMPV